MDYFEIFPERMKIKRGAAEFSGLKIFSHY